MVGFFVCFIELLVCFLLQTTVFTAFDIGGIVPDLLVVLVVATGYHKGKLPGMWMGIFAGLLLDLTFGNLVGVYAFVLMFIGYGCGFLNAYYIRFDNMFPIAMIAVSEFCFMFYSYIVNLLIHRRFDLFYYMRRIMFPKVCYTVIIGIFLYKLLDYIFINFFASAEEDESV